MKKLTFIFALIFISLSFVNCSSDDDNGNGDNGDLLGKWNFSQAGFIVEGEENLITYPHACAESKDYIDINANGTVKIVVHMSDCEEMIESATWTRSGNTLTITQGGESEEGEIVILNDTTLKLKTQEEMGFQGIEVYTRP